MSLFGGRGNYSTIEAPVFEGYDCRHNGDLRITEEGFEDQLSVIEAMHEMDMTELDYKRDLKSLTESSGDIESRTSTYTTVMEGLVSNVWEKIKAFFNKMWGKLKAFFGSVVRFFDGLFKSGKDFATKYEEQIGNLNLSGFKFKMYDYDVDATGAKASNIFSLIKDHLKSKGADPILAINYNEDNELSKKVEALNDEKENIIDSLRGKMLGTSSASKEEYSKGLFGMFRSDATGENDKKELAVDIKKIIAALKNTKDKEVVEKCIKDMDTTFNEYLSSLSKLESKIGDTKSGGENSKVEFEGEQRTKVNYVGHKGESISFVQKCSSLFSEGKDIGMEFFRAWKEAISERNSVYKSVCVNAFRYKKSA